MKIELKENTQNDQSGMHGHGIPLACPAYSNSRSSLLNTYSRAALASIDREHP